MARPSLEDPVRKAVQAYLLTAETLSPEEAPLNTFSVARQLGFNRKTLKKYGLDLEIAEAVRRQVQNGKLSPRQREHRSSMDLLRERDQEIESMRRRCEALIAQIALAEGNAQRLGIDPAELWKPLTVPDRSVPNSRRVGPYRR